jgi:hypothetical protein
MRPNDGRAWPGGFLLSLSLSLVGPMHPLIFQGERDGVYDIYVMTRRSAYAGFQPLRGTDLQSRKIRLGCYKCAVTSRLVTELPSVGTGGGGGR